MRLMPKQTLNVSYSLLFIMTVLCKYIKSKRRADPVCANISFCKKSCLFSQKIIVIDLLPKTCGVWKCLFLGGQHKKCKTFSETDTLCSPGSKGSGSGELQSELLIGGSAL